jgi:putative molybdopterin biosynthesis protein
MRVNSERGRTEYCWSALVQGDDKLSAYPMGKGSGSVTTFKRRGRFHHPSTSTPRSSTAAPRSRCSCLAQGLEPADLVIIGSHCVGSTRWWGA